MKAIVCLSAVVGALAWFHQPAAAQKGRPTIRVVGDGTCPTPVALASRLVAVLTEHRIVVGGSEQAALTIEVFSENERYGVVVSGRRRALLDPGRDCDARARAVAVIAALELYPPTVVDTSPEPSAGELRKGATLRAHALRVGVDLAPMLEIASGAVAGGFSARTFVGGERYGLALGLGGLSPAASPLENAVRVRTWRAPFDVSFRAQHVFGRFELAGDAGFAATVTGMSGEALPSTASATRLELGARLAALLRYRVRPEVAPFLALQGVFVPAPFELGTDDGRVLGGTARVRFGVMLGLTVSIR